MTVSTHLLALHVVQVQLLGILQHLSCLHNHYHLAVHTLPHAEETGSYLSSQSLLASSQQQTYARGKPQ